MYENFFGFSKNPFNITPDPGLLFMTENHQEALSSLIYGIQERRGFISISGEVGTGKTTLLYYLLKNLDPKIRPIFIYQTHLTFEELLKEILQELQLPWGDGSKNFMIRQLHQYLLKTLERGENVALLIDEAQNLSNEVREGLRMLSNMETGEAKLLQIILVGQPELEKKLNSEGLRQLKQRIGIRRQIRPLTEEESRQYIRQRLENMGGSTEDIFSPDALDLICRHSAGIFRSINIMCDTSLLIAYGLQRKTVEASVVREVMVDMGMIVPRQASRSRTVYNPEPVIQARYQISAETDKQEQTRADTS